MMTATCMLDAALDYARRGWRVFPLGEHSKIPKIKGGQGVHDATTDPDQIRDWWERWPDANVGIATGQSSHLVVVDVDPPEGEQTLELLTAVHGAVPDTVQAITGRDGSHYLFAHDGPLSGRNGALGPNVDVKADGGYIVAPPSVHENGQPYVWVCEPGDVELAALPGWVVAELEDKRAPPATNGQAPRLPVPADGITAYARKVLEEETAALAATTTGNRNEQTNKVAFRLGQLIAGGQLPEHVARAELEHACERNGVLAEEPRATHRTIDSGLTDGAREPQYPDPTRTPAAPPASRAPTVHVNDEHPGTDHALADGFRGTEVGNADRFVAACDGRARYVHAWGRWIVYDETRGVWKIDTGDALVTEKAKQVARRMFRAAIELHGEAREALWKWAKRSEAAATIASTIRLARGIAGILVDHQDLDNEPWLLNVANGTIDLRTGALRPHDPDDLITLQAPTRFEPDAPAELWDACLQRWQPDPEVRAYLQRVIGTGATGIPIEHLFINVGPGSNGKGKFYGAVAHVLGDYVVVPHKSLLTVQRHEQHDTIKARLFGARLAVAGETDTNDRIDEAKVKDITGGDLLEARRMREDPWKFAPSHTMVMHTNHRPRVRGTDEGVWRRLRLIRWDTIIPAAERDDRLAIKLETEASGILNWIVAGALDWQHQGLHEPGPVATATAGYRADEDSLAAFLEEYCELHASYREAAAELYKAYEEWCAASGNEPVTKKSFATMLTERGFSLTRDRRFRGGLRLLGDEDARFARFSRMTLYAHAREEVTGRSAQSAHDEDTIALPLDGPPDPIVGPSNLADALAALDPDDPDYGTKVAQLRAADTRWRRTTDDGVN